MNKLVYIIAVLFLFACSSPKKEQQIFGEAQGTTYTIKYISDNELVTKGSIDSILSSVDLSLSTYTPHSLISRFNQCNDEIIFYPWQDKYFEDVFFLSKQVYAKTDGAFNPAVMPLVNYWGFGYDTARFSEIDSSKVIELKSLNNFSWINLEHQILSEKNEEQTIELHIVKENPNMEIDFNAIAQGYTVDVLVNVLMTKGINNFMVELGGEVYVKGKNKFDKSWTVGVDEPKLQMTRELEAIISIEDMALATSGNYRKFYEKDGMKFAHTIDPNTGFPVQHNLLSATVVAKNCAIADAYATAFMVMGKDRALEFLENNKQLGLRVYFISQADSGEYDIYCSEELQENISRPI